MTLDNLTRPAMLTFLIWLGSLIYGVIVSPSLLASGQVVSQRYGPTVPSGYYVRVEPRALTMSHTQRPQITVVVEDASGKSVEDVPVRFVPSEGSFTTGTSQTRGGVVVGMFTAATGSDNPRAAFVIVTVENVEVTVFIDIVPAVFGR